MRVNDMEETLRFYVDILGLTVENRKRSPRGSELVFLSVPNSDEVIEICSFPAGGQVNVPEDLVHLAFEVDDLDQMILRFRENRVPVTEGPTTTSSGSRLCFIEAPDKYEVELIERPKAQT